MSKELAKETFKEIPNPPPQFGYAKYCYDNGNERDYYEYNGNWDSCQFDGEGFLTNHEGQFSGTFKCGEKHGYGFIEYNHITELLGKTFEGFWNQGDKQGIGIMTTDSGKKYLQKWNKGFLQEMKPLN